MAKAKNRAAEAGPVEQAPEAVTAAPEVTTQAPEVAEPPAPPEPTPVAIPPLNDFIKQMERDVQEKYGLAITKISHPEAEDGAVFQGTYAGIPLVKGEPGMLLSDGRGFGSLDRDE